MNLMSSILLFYVIIRKNDIQLKTYIKTVLINIQLIDHDI